MSRSPDNWSQDFDHVGPGGRGGKRDISPDSIYYLSYGTAAGELVVKVKIARDEGVSRKGLSAHKPLVMWDAIRFEGRISYGGVLRIRYLPTFSLRFEDPDSNL